jgi:hypothetical protein
LIYTSGIGLVFEKVDTAVTVDATAVTLNTKDWYLAVLSSLPRTAAVSDILDWPDGVLPRLQRRRSLPRMTEVSFFSGFRQTNSVLKFWSLELTLEEFQQGILF